MCLCWFSLFSGDGSLCVVDLRQRRLEERSDCNESELLSVAIVKVIVDDVSGWNGWS